MSAVRERRPERGGAGGFTLIEVMISLLIFMVALMGLVALQQASIAGTSKGREHTSGVNVARYVLTRLQNEAATWPLTEALAPATDFPMLAAGLASPGSWSLLPPAANAFRLDSYLEHSSRDFYTAASGVDSAPYCVNYMVQPVGPGSRPDDLLRVRVRVVWPKRGQYSAGWNSCAPALVDARLPDSDVVELSGIVTREFTGRMVQ